MFYVDRHIQNKLSQLIINARQIHKIGKIKPPICVCTQISKIKTISPQSKKAVMRL